MFWAWFGVRGVAGCRTTKKEQAPDNMWGLNTLRHAIATSCRKAGLPGPHKLIEQLAKFFRRRSFA